MIPNESNNQDSILNTRAASELPRDPKDTLSPHKLDITVLTDSSTPRSTLLIDQWRQTEVQ